MILLFSLRSVVGSLVPVLVEETLGAERGGRPPWCLVTSLRRAPVEGEGAKGRKGWRMGRGGTATDHRSLL